MTENVGYETRDASVRIVIWFVIILVGTTFVTYLAIDGLFHIFRHRVPSPEPPSRIALDAQMIAPPPQLQIAPTADLEKFTAEENAKLNSYGWVDREHGIIRIPIERAMDLVAQRGLPTRGPGTQNSSGKTPEQLQEDKAAATKP